MPKARNPKADEAEALYNKGFKLIEISKQMELPEGTVRRWKSVYNWGAERSNKKNANVRKSKGAPRGNQNAKGAGAPKRIPTPKSTVSFRSISRRKHLISYRLLKRLIHLTCCGTRYRLLMQPLSERRRSHT